MHKLTFTFALLCLVSGSLVAQPKPRQFILGLDATKSLFNNSFDLKGNIVEPTVKFSLSDNLLLNLTGGYSHLQKDTVLINQHYSSEGFYLKIMLESPRFRDNPKKASFFTGGGLVLSRFREYSYWILKGNYFEDKLIETNTKRNFALGFEGYVGLNVPLFNQLSFNLLSRIDFMPFNSALKADNVLYYTPGIGMIAGSGADKNGGLCAALSAGFSLQLAYQIR